MAERSKPVHFLLAEDDDDHAMLVMRAMSDHRISNDIVRVSNGEAAVAYLRNEPPYEEAKRPDVILLDLKMPKMDGHEVLEAIQDDPELAKIPSVVLTTSAVESDRARAYAARANSYVVKPLDFGRFNELVRELQLYWAVWNEPVS